jgi:hypothetical protein
MVLHMKADVVSGPSHLDGTYLLHTTRGDRFWGPMVWPPCGHSSTLASFKVKLGRSCKKRRGGIDGVVASLL